MTEKINQYRYFIITLITITLLGAAASYFYNKVNEIPLAEGEVQFNFSIDGRNYIMPSPFHSFHFLNSLDFSWNELAELNTTSAYSMETQAALNLGSRAASGIVMLFANERENARKTRTVVLELADRLDIVSEIATAVAILDNAVVVHADQAILDEKIIHLQYELEKALHKKKKDKLAVLVELGGWLEGLNIASKGITNNYNPGHAEILRQPHIAEIYIDVVTALSEKTNDQKERQLLNSIQFYLNKIYKIVNYSHKESFPIEKVKELYKVSSEIKKIIESTQDIPQK